jgi:hypothetical protein
MKAYEIELSMLICQSVLCIISLTNKRLSDIIICFLCLKNYSNMRTPFFLCLFLFTANLCYSQSANALSNTTTPDGKKLLPKHLIQAIGGPSRHGSGDMRGVIFGTAYRKYTSPKFSLEYSIKGTIHSSVHTLIFTDNTFLQSTDASVRFTTAGVQLGVNGGLSLIRTRKDEFIISLGVFGRYQSASNGDDGYGLYYPQQTNVPTILVGYDNRTPQQTGAFGGLLQLHYNHTFNNKIAIGIAPGFQTDTHGDAIPYAALTIGRRL